MSKQEQRRAALAARRALSEEQRAAYSAAICHTLAAYPPLREARIILSYRALRDEVDPAALEGLLDARFAYPRCLPDRSVEARIPTGSLISGAYGILEPDPAASLFIPPELIDAVLLPCLGFDADGNRLGHGAGYYDRTLPRCRRALRVCLAFEAQRLARVETDSHDCPVELIVTEKRIIDPKELRGG